MPLPVFPSWGLPSGSLGGSSPFVAEALGAGFHGWGVSCVVCADAASGCVWHSLSVAYVLSRVLCACGACVGVGVGVAWPCPRRALVCVCVCVFCVSGGSLGDSPRLSGLGLAAGVGASPWVQISAIPGSGPMAAVVVGPSRILAEGPGMLFPAIPGWSLLPLAWGCASCVFVVCGVCVRVLLCVVWCSWSLLWCLRCFCLCGCGICVPVA